MYPVPKKEKKRKKEKRTKNVYKGEVKFKSDIFGFMRRFTNTNKGTSTIQKVNGIMK